MDFEAMIRLFVAPLGTKEEIIATLEQVLDDAREMLRFSGEVKQEFLEGIAVTQDQVYIRALAVDFFISLLNTVEAWAQRTLDEIESWNDLSPDGKNERALEKLRELPAPTPGSIKTTPLPPALSAKGTDARDKVLRTQRRPGPRGGAPWQTSGDGARDRQRQLVPARSDLRGRRARCIRQPTLPYVRDR
jgi:hypothetical protein